MAKIGREYTVTAREITIATHGLSFLCILGQHISGAYMAIVNFGISAELSALDDVGYNTMRILTGLMMSQDKWLPTAKEALYDIAKEIAEAINPYILKESE